MFLDDLMVNVEGMLRGGKDFRSGKQNSKEHFLKNFFSKRGV